MELAESIKQLKEASNNNERNDDKNHDERESNNKNGTPFVTMLDVVDLLKQERERTPIEPKFFARKPPYPMEHLKEKKS